MLHVAITREEDRYLTQRMAQLRAKAHQIRKGHIARLEETKEIYRDLPTSAKKKASAQLAGGYNQLIGIDTRLERLDHAVAANEKRIKDLTRIAQRYLTKNDHKKLYHTIKQAEKLQKHNSHLFKLIDRTEQKLIAITEAVTKTTRQVNDE